MYKPEFPYKGNKLIVNSDRIIINSKKDSIFLFSNKVINFSSNEGIHFNTNKDIFMNGKNIKLGLNADEPLVKGNQLKNLLEKLLNDLHDIGETLSKSTDSNNVPITGVVTAGDSLKKSINRIKTLLNKINSNNIFTE